MCFWVNSSIFYIFQQNLTENCKINVLSIKQKVTFIERTLEGHELERFIKNKISETFFKFMIKNQTFTTIL